MKKRTFRLRPFFVFQFYCCVCKIKKAILRNEETPPLSEFKKLMIVSSIINSFISAEPQVRADQELRDKVEFIKTWQQNFNKKT
ncbi:hypothetical protein P9597_14760 [Aneurinibacillus migulanus]|uniref:hypothetical protein n=1 Tax=Aneurinibacillus migulanus TaxID=47500 RepID=UPI002E22DDE9|nr:hypothetical protein [Aneurinibacillus migulanus]